MFNDKLIEIIGRAKKHLDIAEYFLDVTMELTSDKRLMSKSLVELQKATTSIIDASFFVTENTLQPNKEVATKIFFKKIGPKIMSNKDTDELKKILVFTKKYKNSHLGFAKKDKYVIFGRFECKILTKKGLKKSIFILRRIIQDILEKRKI